jgi:hypothetical protein
MRWKILLVLAPVVLLVMGGQQLYKAMKNPNAVKITCADYLAKPPDSHWLTLESCTPDWEGGAYESAAGSTTARVLFVPLRPTGVEGGQTRIVLRTEDKALLDLVNSSNAEMPATTSWQGVVQFGLDLKDEERKEVGGLISGLADDFVLLEHNAKPNMGMAIAFLLGGLGLAGFVVWRFIKNRREGAA